MKKQLKALLVALALVAGVLAGPRAARADDTLTLKDGRVLQGTVVREVNGYVWFKVKTGSLETEQMFKPEDISKLEKDAKPAAAPEAAAPAGDEKKPEAAATPGAPRIAVISLGAPDEDMVGVYMTAEELRRLIPLLEAEKIDTVVFKINSGGGLGLEVQRLSDVIHNEYKPKFRVVAWIESAISAAAMTAHCIEEIYMMPRGNYGACTGWYGQLVAVEGRPLQEMLYQMEKISARGKHDPQIMRSMQIQEPLSCTIDENGDVHWYNNLKGDHIVNPEGRILTFNSQTAVKYKFAKGVAATYQELGKAMGLNEFTFVGKVVPSVPYPVCRAEEEMIRFRNQVKDDEDRTREYFDTYGTSIEAAQQAAPEDRGKYVGRARDALSKIKRMVANNPNFALLVFNRTEDQFKDWVDEQEEILRKLMRRP
jgi:hypothetical protein